MVKNSVEWLRVDAATAAAMGCTRDELNQLQRKAFPDLLKRLRHYTDDNPFVAAALMTTFIRGTIKQAPTREAAETMLVVALVTLLMDAFTLEDIEEVLAALHSAYAPQRHAPGERDGLGAAIAMMDMAAKTHASNTR
jgi:hypothetical protein